MWQDCSAFVCPSHKQNYRVQLGGLQHVTEQWQARRATRFEMRLMPVCFSLVRQIKTRHFERSRRVLLQVT